MLAGLVLGSALLSLGVATPAQAQLVRSLRPLHGEVFDLVLRNSDDPDLLSSRQASLRQKLLDLGVEPREGGRPTLDTIFRRRLADAADWPMLRPPREVEILEVDWGLQKVFLFRFPETHLFYSDVDTNEVGIAFEAPRDMEDLALEKEVHRLDAWQRQWVAIGLRDQLRKQLQGRAQAAKQSGDLLNFTIPINLPRTLERVIGRGDATSIRISGQLNIQIGGRSESRGDFIGNEVQQEPSLFPSLEMEQSMRVNLDGQVGEKIKVRVRHDSEQIGGEATEVKLAFEGDEDDIIQTIRAGDIDITLPGSRLLGVGASKGGLFGVKVEGAVGPVEFTALTSKEQSQSNEQTFSQNSQTENELTIEADQFAKHRFFLLNAPRPVYFEGFDGAPSDQTTYRADGTVDLGPDDWRIDPSSIEIYVAIGAGVSDDNTFDGGIAFVDESGVGWEGPSDPLNPGDLAQLVDEGKAIERNRWRRLIRGSDWDVLQDADTEAVVGVALNRSYGDNDVLATTYQIRDQQGQGSVVRSVGRSVTLGADALIANPSAPSEQVHFFKLLKSDTEPFNFENVQTSNEGTFSATALCWEYELRNYYDLRGRDINPEDFQFRIERTSNALENPANDEELGPDGQGTNLQWFRVLGLDRFNRSGTPGSPDGEPDVNQPAIFNLSAGILQFPSRTPFDPSPAELDTFTNGQLTSLEAGDGSVDLASPRLYQKTLTRTELAEANKFRLVVTQTSVSSRLRLNAFNIQEGSEEVTLNGRVLQKNVDYTIDYFSGEVNLMGEAAASLNAQSNIQVKYEVDPLFGGGRSSLSGINLTYRLGTQNQLSTTWLLKTQPNNATKPRLGEEPSKNWVGNLSGKFQLQPRWLRDVANWLPRVDSDQDVSLNFDGETAVSVPNPNTRNEAYLEDFESVDQSVNVSLSRQGWVWASLPAEYTKGRGHRDYGPADRAYAGWHRGIPGVKREFINPTLSEQESRDILPSLELRVISDAGPDSIWAENEYAGIMRSLGGEVDLSQAQFLEFWLDDGTGNVPEERLEIDRPGTLHFDFGYINEDFFWKKTAPDGQAENALWVVGEYDTEDRDNDGLLSIVDGRTEDTGLDGLESSQETSLDELIPNRPGRGGDPAGDDFSAESGEGNVFLYINGNEGNQDLDSEDLDLSGNHDLADGYFTLTLELSDLDKALVDVYRDYADYPDFIRESELENRAWRKYRLDLRDIVTRVAQSEGEFPEAVTSRAFTSEIPDLARVRTLRIWYEDDSGGPAERRIRLAEMRFLGNRWLNDRIRDANQAVIPPAVLGSEEFRLGVLNNKENPEYRPPVFPDTRNNVAEKEQALQFLYDNLEPGHMARARKDIPGRQGQDYTVYQELNFFWREPYRNGIRDPQQQDLEVFYWVGSDSLNYYEIAFPFADVETDGDGWQECRLDMREMTNVKFNDFEPLNPGDPSSPSVQRGVIRDRLTGEPYQVTVRGRPDLTQVQRFYAGVRYPLDGVAPDGSTGPPLSGEVLFNEIRLKEVNDEVGYAQRYAGSLSIPDLADFQFEWRQTDEEFRGLNDRQGSGVLQRGWSARVSSRLQNLVPTLGLDIPFALSKRVDLSLPKFAPRTDIELLTDDARDSLRTESVAESFNFQVRKSKPSQNKILQFLVDPFQYSLSGARSTRTSPTRDSRQESADTKINYDLRVRRGLSFRVPFTRTDFRYTPSQVTLGSTWRWDIQQATEKRSDGTLIPREPQLTKTSINNMTLIFQPLESVRGSFSMSSNRDLLLGSKEILGIDIGQEQTFNQRLNVKFTPESKWLKWAKPDLDYTVVYNEDRRPGVRQQALGGSPDEADDGFLGEAGQVRNMRNSQEINLKGQVDLTGWIKDRFGPDRSTTQTPDARRRSRREAARVGRGRRDATAPPAQTTTETATDAADTTAVDEGAGDEEQETGQDDFGQPDPDQPDPDQEDPFADSPPPPEPDRPADEEEADSEEPPAEDGAAGQGEFDAGAIFDKMVLPFRNLVFNLQPVRSSWTRTRGTNYTQVNKRADALYRFGFTTEPSISESEKLRVGPNPEDTRAYASQRLEIRHRFNFSTQSQILDDLRIEASYTRQQSSTEGTQGASRDYNWEVPVNLRLSQVQDWKMWGDLFATSSIDLTVRRTKRESRIVEGQQSFPSTTWAVQPRWTFRFQNELDANLNVTWSKDVSGTSLYDNISTQWRGNLKLQKNFDANGRLSFLRFGRRGTGTTIDMNVDIGYRRESSFRQERRAGNVEDDGKDQQRSRTSITVNPRFSYQFNRNLRAGLKIEFSRSTDNTRPDPTTSLGLFFDATLTF